MKKQINLKSHNDLLFTTMEKLTNNEITIKDAEETTKFTAAVLRLYTMNIKKRISKTSETNLKSHNDLLKDIENIKKENSDSQGGKIKLIEGIIKTLNDSITYQKLKARIQLIGELTDEEFINDVYDDGLLSSVFGNDDIIENEKKLKELKKAFKEISSKTV